MLPVFGSIGIYGPANAIKGDQKMLNPNIIIFYVASADTSAAFYTDLLGHEPVDAGPSFVMYALGNGLMFGLWSRDAAEPSADITGGGTELCIPVDGDAAVDSTYADWKARGLVILQDPTKMGFGYTFVAADADGHRLRVFAPQ